MYLNHLNTHLFKKKKKNPYAFFNPIILMSVLTKPFKTHLFLLSSVSVSFLFPPPYSHTSC